MYRICARPWYGRVWWQRINHKISLWGQIFGEGQRQVRSVLVRSDGGHTHTQTDRPGRWARRQESTRVWCKEWVRYVGVYTWGQNVLSRLLVHSGVSCMYTLFYCIIDIVMNATCASIILKFFVCVCVRGGRGYGRGQSVCPCGGLVTLIPKSCAIPLSKPLKAFNYTQLGSGQCLKWVCLILMTREQLLKSLVNCPSHILSFPSCLWLRCLLRCFSFPTQSSFFPWHLIPSFVFLQSASRLYFHLPFYCTVIFSSLSFHFIPLHFFLFPSALRRMCAVPLPSGISYSCACEKESRGQWSYSVNQVIQ